MPTLFQRLSGFLAESPLLRGGRDLWRANLADWNLPLSKVGKVKAGLYILLRDHADGLFPPRFEDQQKAYDAEKAYDFTLPGLSGEEVRVNGMRKPFWSARTLVHFMGLFGRLAGGFHSLGVRPPQKVLELGCGKGWMAEMLAQMGYRVLGTTLTEIDVAHANQRVDALRAKGLPENLAFRACPMESVDEAVRDAGPFDAAFVFEALHHAYDWRRSLTAAGRCLRPGGWLVLANEPNLLHTFVSYRVARLSSTHEIGMSRRQIRAHLLANGFSRVRILGGRPGFFHRAHWIAAQRAP